MVLFGLFVRLLRCPGYVMWRAGGSEGRAPAALSRRAPDRRGALPSRHGLRLYSPPCSSSALRSTLCFCRSLLLGLLLRPAR